jgi:hypothetical protein
MCADGLLLQEDSPNLTAPAPPVTLDESPLPNWTIRLTLQVSRINGLNLEQQPIMIRRKRFTRAETVILWVFASLLGAAGIAGLFFSATSRAPWMLALASLGVLGIAAVYGLAARRGKPL